MDSDGSNQTQLTNAQVNLNRNVPLLSRGFATDQQVTDQRSQVAQLQSAIESDQAAIDDARTQLSYTTLTAPFDATATAERESAPPTHKASPGGTTPSRFPDSDDSPLPF